MSPTGAVKRAIWIYFWLLLLEGVLRKWVFPEWSDLLFVVRDPVALICYLLAWRAGVFPWRPSVAFVYLLAVLSLAFSFAGEATFLVTLFGLRTNYLHLPLVFVMASVLDRSDVLRVGRWMMIASLPIVALMLVQFNSDPDAPINAGVGGRDSGQLIGAMGRIRPPGPFSFISGVVAFFALLAAFVFYGWVHSRTYPRLLLLCATAAATIAIPVSISRSLLLAILVVAVFGAAVSVRDLKRLPLYLGPVIGVSSMLLVMIDSVYVQTALARWQEAATTEGGDFYSNVVGRMLGDFLQPFAFAVDTPLLGHGVGLGTVAASRMMTGKYTFLLAESELARIVLELGPLLGFAFIGWRVWLVLAMVVRGWRAFVRTGEPLAWMMAGAAFPAVFNGQWGPATQLGFAVFGAGLALAALNVPQEDESDEESEEGERAE